MAEAGRQLLHPDGGFSSPKIFVMGDASMGFLSLDIRLSRQRCQWQNAAPCRTLRPGVTGESFDA